MSLVPSGLTDAQIQQVASGIQQSVNEYIIDSEFKQFGEFEPAVGPDFKSTADFIFEAIQGKSRPNTPMAPIQEWECRIGGSRFFVPPISISVSETFQSGSNGAALRQQTPVRFNAGHSETIIVMTLYFPTHDTIWGFEGESLEINFDKEQDDVIDRYISSLRGLITQFKYTPILPVKNAYLNGTHNISAVALQSLSISSMENFPFCLAVNLTMLKFNHKVFLPMVEEFDNAIHWGRFRQYIGRAAEKLQEIASKDFLSPPFETPDKKREDHLYGIARLEKPTSIDIPPDRDMLTNTVKFDKLTDFQEGKNIELFYPDHDPARIIGPDLGTFRTANQPKGTKEWAQALANMLGLPSSGPGSFAEVLNYPDAIQLSKEYNAINAWMKSTSTTLSHMGSGKLNEFRQKYRRSNLPPNASQEQKDELDQAVTSAWYYKAYQDSLMSPEIQQILAFQQFLRGQIQIQEWDVPMRKLGLDNPNVIVNSVSATMGNCVVPMQLALQNQPTYQHIGGLGTTVEITMTVFGEEDLGRLRNMYETINGLSRLEHGHAVLGFLGIKNVITALAGIKYCIPQAFEVSTLPNYPHVYSVRLVFMDFDVFQQKREMLSAEQQAELVEAFSKKNPFLRLKQLWGSFNGYPDFPLSIYDDNGKLVGHYDPDYYFRAFKTVDDDIVNWRQKKLPKSQTEDDTLDALRPQDPTIVDPSAPKKPKDYEIIHHLGQLSDDGTTHSIGLHAQGFDLREGNQAFAANLNYNEPHPGNTLTEAYVPGCTPAANYMHPYADGSDNPDGQSDAMMRDSQYRDKTGRMIRAYPTYMLWLIDEGGKFAGQKMFDNFYGLQSVLDFSIVRSEDILGDTLVVRISNLYSRLSTKYKDLIDPTLFPDVAQMINTQWNRQRNLLSGFSNYLVKLDTIQLQPGVRVHMRMGYSANPNLLETVFNGMITQVEQGDIITITCQSDAIELSPVVNNKHQHADTGHIDGSLLGSLQMSEPRDLMTRLLSMGASTFRETIANMTHGMIFSENRFGIRHFGSILYEPMTKTEKDLTDAKANKMKVESSGWAGFFTGGPLGAVAGLFTTGMGDLMTSLWINFNRKRDFEVFKRNIYPGNGTGVAQYMGGDLGDGGVANMFMPVGVNEDGTPGSDPNTGMTPVPDPSVLLGQANDAAKRGLDKTGPPGSVGSDLLSVVGSSAGQLFGLSAAGNANLISQKTHPIMQMLGLTSKVGDDDVGGGGGLLPGVRPFDEVSFRAQTYMKSVWDLFQVCAALLPNYIVAVRPFEDRSTVFYGKPHWMYTSGVIPISKGVKEGEGPPYTGPDEEMQDILKDAQKKKNKHESPDEFYNRISQAGQPGANPSSNEAGGDPNATPTGTPWSGGDISSLPLTHPTSGAMIPVRIGGVGVEMHLPTSPNLQTDIAQHQQIDALPPNMRHPFYMDRQGGVHGGYEKSEDTNPNPNPAAETILKEDAQLPGEPSGAFGYLTPEEEQWYMNMDWPTAHNYPNAYKHKRVLVYHERTKQAVVCVPGDWGPNTSKTGAVIAGISPDAWWMLGKPSGGNDKCWFGWVDDSTPLGPVQFTSAAQVRDSGLPITNVANDPAAAPNSTLNSGNQPPPSTSDIPSWMSSHPQQGQGGDVATFAMRWGWEDSDVPVNYTNDKIKDQVGQGASEVYKDQRSEDEANDIWDEFRGHFGSDSQTKDIFKFHYPNKADRYNEVVRDFQQFMWQNAYHRGWIVETADAQVSLASLTTGDLKTAAGWVSGSAANAVQKATDVISQLNPFSDGHQSNHWDFDRAHKLWEVFLTQGQSGAIEWMKANSGPGKDQTGILGRTIEEAKTKIWDKFANIFSTIQKAVGSVLNGVVSIMRMSLLTLSGGLNMSAYAGRQANVLNHVFNDSVYYQAGPPGSLLYYADNVFTREYGEPVVEIRQPFQRIHHIDSFSHIINDGIVENLDNVATVITATSGDKHPVTVHFDKGAPTEKQVEKSVETGLFLDMPKGLSRLVHPMQTLRSWASHFNNGDAETSAKRCALWYLKESLKDIYTGEVIILGDPSIRPFDLVHMSDVYERIYGLFEVEQVVHHFNTDTGFITAITPNALVNINDPARWQVGSIMTKQWQVHALRNEMRHQMGITADNTRIYGNQKVVDSKELLDRSETALKGSIQYTGGISALVKDVGGMGGIGAIVNGASAGNPVLGAAVGIAGWSAFKWVRDNVLDAHGCYIQYLNKNARPMDAGLSYNHGVAVGQIHGYRILEDVLGTAIPTPIDGHLTISTNDILTNLGWNEHQIEDLSQNGIDMWTSQANAQILKLSGRAPEVAPLMPPSVHYVTVTGVENGDTIQISPAISGHSTVRMKFIHAPHDGIFNQDTAANRAYEYAVQTLKGKDVALRIDPTAQTDPSDNSLLAVIFSNVPPSIPDDQRQDTLTQTALNYPAIQWDSFMPDGRAYSFNWQTVLAGNAQVAAEKFESSLPGQGVIGAGG